MTSTPTETAPPAAPKTALSVGVLVTNYNSWELARQCIEAHLALHGDRLARVVLLDDASPTPPPFDSDGRYELIVNPTNLGFAANLNKGVALMGTDIVLIFDADARPLTPYLDALLAAFEADPKLALTGFATVDEAGQPTPSHDKEPNIWSLILGQAVYARLQKWIERPEKRVILWLCTLGVRRTAFEALGGFDEGFDLLEADVDLSMRVHRAGWRLQFLPDVVAVHSGGGTPMTLSSRLLRFYANRWRVLAKHGKVALPGVCKLLILLRLRVELAVLRALGAKLFPDPAVRRDKLAGRQRIIRYCRQNF